MFFLPFLFVLHSFRGIIEVEVIFFSFFLFLCGKIAKSRLGWIKEAAWVQRGRIPPVEIKKRERREKLKEKKKRDTSTRKLR